MPFCLKKHSSLVLVAIALSPRGASAEAVMSCPTIDLRSKNFSMENVNKTHQNRDLGVCYAHGAVKALESKMKILGIVPKDFKASIFAAFATNEEKDRFADPLDKISEEEAKQSHSVAFGNFCKFMDQIKREGVCDYNNFEGTATSLTSIKATVELSAKAESKSFYLLKQLENHYKKSVERTSPQEMQDYITSLKNQFKAIQEKAEKSHHIDDFSVLELLRKKIEDIDALMTRTSDSCSIPKNRNGYKKYFTLKGDVDKAMIKLSPLGYLRETVKNNCGIRKGLFQHPEISNLGCETNQLFKKANLEEKVVSSHKFINAEFSKGTQAGPIGINYVAGFLVGKETQNSDSMSSMNTPSAINGAHLSLIIGQKKIKIGEGKNRRDVCAYLVRNSLGKDCRVYNKSNVDMICEDGDTWIEDKELMKRTTELYNPFSDKVRNLRRANLTH